jgi:GT2 family glycosyltransferase
MTMPSNTSPDPLTAHSPTVTVVICAYSEKRWDQIAAAVASVDRQSHSAIQLVMVIDHNSALLGRALGEFDHCDVMPNTDAQGLSGSRNVGVSHAVGEIVAFLDDDACADPGWLEALVAPYRDASVLGTGGVAQAVWPTVRPSWFPSEFDWVVGCSYKGLPQAEEPIRNPIGANMSFRRSAFETAGGFHSVFGRMGRLPLGCEETEFSIRLRQHEPGARIVYVPLAVVDHFVGADRTNIRYFLQRCVAEGLSKATVTTHVGNAAGLSSERRYMTRVLPRGFFLGFVPGPRRGESSVTRSCMIGAGLLATTLGYILGRLRLDWVVGALIRPQPATSGQKSAPDGSIA